MVRSKGAAKGQYPVQRRIISLRYLVAALDNSVDDSEHDEADAYLKERLGAFRCKNSGDIELHYLDRNYKLVTEEQFEAPAPISAPWTWD